jgi:hypothetical protein
MKSPLGPSKDYDNPRMIPGYASQNERPRSLGYAHNVGWPQSLGVSGITRTLVKAGIVGVRVL